MARTVGLLLSLLQASTSDWHARPLSESSFGLELGWRSDPADSASGFARELPSSRVARLRAALEAAASDPPAGGPPAGDDAAPALASAVRRAFAASGEQTATRQHARGQLHRASLAREAKCGRLRAFLPISFRNRSLPLAFGLLGGLLVLRGLAGLEASDFVALAQVLGPVERSPADGAFEAVLPHEPRVHEFATVPSARAFDAPSDDVQVCI